MPATAYVPGQTRDMKRADARPTRSRPIVVLTYAESGYHVLRAALDQHPQIACLLDAGIVPLCRHAVETWGRVEQQPARRASALGLAMTRSMVGALVTPVLARRGKQRWCDISPGAAPAAPAFLELYPDAQFICLHRNCLDVIASILESSRWGIIDNGFWRFAAAHPGNNVAALANYWIIHAKAIISFQDAHPDQCMDVRYEDLMTRPEQARTEIFAFLGNDRDSVGMDMSARPGQYVEPRAIGEDVRSAGDHDPSRDSVPADLIPPHMLAELNDILSSLGYRAIR
jgi:protein-tyrosine sulfotransferase